MKITDQNFFNKSACELAPLLLGKILCRRKDGQVIRSRITEVEAYCGEEDSACHSARGKTERTKVMWEQGGTVYVYLCYGMHHMLNIVCAGNRPEAVLIRGVEDAKGPGRVAKKFDITRVQNGTNLKKSSEIWLEDTQAVTTFHKGPRIGIDYAHEPDKSAPLRFWID